MSKMSRIHNPKSAHKRAPKPPQLDERRLAFKDLMKRASYAADCSTDRFGNSVKRGSVAWHRAYHTALIALHKTPATIS